jgi:hypothetical protein
MTAGVQMSFVHLPGNEAHACALTALPNQLSRKKTERIPQVRPDFS